MLLPDATPSVPGARGGRTRSAGRVHRSATRDRRLLPALSVLVAALLMIGIVRSLAPTIEASGPGPGPVPARPSEPAPAAAVAVGGDGLVDRAALDRRVGETRAYERATALLSAVAVGAAMLVLGGGIFLLTISGRPIDLLPRQGRSRRLLRSATIAGATACVLGVPVRAGLVGGSTAMLDPGAWWFAVTTPVGTAAAIRLAGLVLLQHALRTRPVRIGRPVVFVRGGVSFVGGLVIAPDAVRRAGAAASASLLVSSFVLVGHAQASEPRWLLVLCDLVHVIAGSVWLGGVVLLVLELRRRGGSRAVAATAVSVDRFSKAAAAAVVTMFATGTVLAWGQLHTVDRLFSTSYGITLLCKLAFVLVVVGLGGYNHHVLVPGVARGDSERAWQRLRRTVTIEAVVLLAGVLPMTVAMSTGGLRNLA